MGSGLQKAYTRQKKKNKRRSREIVEKSSSQVVLHGNDIPQDFVDVLHNIDIPQDLVDEIFFRLPIKSLFRFKAVSKFWHSTISDPSFRRRCPAATFVFGISYSGSRFKEFFSIDEKGSYKEFPIPDCCIEYKHLPAGLSNSCNGILLLSLGPHIFLVNPSTHYFEKVLQLDDLRDWVLGYTMGFCYDESIGDYKAVIIRTNFVMVASLKENKWTELRTPRTVYDLRPQTILVNDRLHTTFCLCGNHFGLRNAIIYFNPTKDVFEKVPCPHPRSGDGDIVGLGVLEGCLCMARMIRENNLRGDVEFLVMKEYGVAESWITLFVLKNWEVYWYSGRMIPLFRTDNGDILIMHYYHSIWRYNLANKSCTKFIWNQGKTYISDAVPFVENLFSPCI